MIESAKEQLEPLKNAAWEYANGRAEYKQIDLHPLQAAYHSMILNFEMLLAGKISKAAASEIQKNIEMIYSDEMKYRYIVSDLNKRTEAARSAYRLNPTIENADRLAAAIDGGMRK